MDGPELGFQCIRARAGVFLIVVLPDTLVYSESHILEQALQKEYLMFRAEQKHVDQYNEDGYLLVESLFTPEEVALLMETAQEDRQLARHAHSLDDGEGGITDVSAWYIAGDDLYGMFARCRRVVDTCELLLGHDVYHYHSKMILKEPRTGGAWTWHQDYGYWYQFGYLLPDLISCMIAVDRATEENGCLQVLKGSHKMGRVDHELVGEQSGANAQRVEMARKRFPLVACEMEPGTALFFHSNILHASAQNKSPHSRWSLICCYTTTNNISDTDPDHPGYDDHSLVKVPDTAILEMGKRGFHTDPEFAGKDVDKYSGKPG